MEVNQKNQNELKNQVSENNDIWFKSGPLLTYNKTLNFVVGNRGGGKTIEMMRLITQCYLKQGKTAIWLRRWDVELDQKFFKKFYDDPAFYEQFPDYDFHTKKEKYGGEGSLKLKGTETYDPYIQFMCLSTALKHKSIPFPTVKYIIFDEFIIDKKKTTMNYLKNEVFVFLELLQSIMRLREDVRVIFVGNSISKLNPYFAWLNIRRITEEKEFYIGKEYALQYYKNAEYTQKLRESRFGRLVEGTEYGNYAIDNQFIRDDESFVQKKPNNAIYWFGIKYDDKYISVWQDSANMLYYIHYSIDKNSMIFALTTDDHTIDTTLVSRISKSFPIRALLDMYDRGRVRFETFTVKAIFYDIIYILKY